METLECLSSHLNVEFWQVPEGETALSAEAFCVAKPFVKTCLGFRISGVPKPPKVGKGKILAQYQAA